MPLPPLMLCNSEHGKNLSTILMCFFVTTGAILRYVYEANKNLISIHYTDMYASKLTVGNTSSKLVVRSRRNSTAAIARASSLADLLTTLAKRSWNLVSEAI